MTRKYDDPLDRIDLEASKAPGQGYENSELLMPTEASPVVESELSFEEGGPSDTSLTTKGIRNLSDFGHGKTNIPSRKKLPDRVSGASNKPTTTRTLVVRFTLGRGSQVAWLYRLRSKQSGTV